jgi:hypothetical protein
MNAPACPKERARAYLAQRQQVKAPLPSMAEIRRQLGWYLVPRKLLEGAV